MRKLLPILYISLSLFLLGCEAREHTMSVFDEWGRGRLLGIASEPSRVGLAAVDDGVVVAFPTRDADSGPHQIRWIALDTEGNIVHDTELDLPTQEPREITLRETKDGNLFLFYFKGFHEERALQVVKVSREGTLQGELRQLTADGGIDWFKPLVMPNGEIALFWLDNNGVLSTTTVRDDSIDDSASVITAALRADVQIDRSGQTHIVWAEQQSDQLRVFNYATYDRAAGTLSESVSFASFGVGPDASDNVVDGPVLSLDMTYLYVAWGRQLSTPAGFIARPYFSTAPLTSSPPAFSEEQILGVARQFPIPTQPADGHFQYAELSPIFTGVSGTTAALSAPVALDGQHEEVAFTYSINYSTRSRNGYQPTLIYMQDGEPVGYQTLTWTERTSRRVHSVVDDNNHLYTIWSDSQARSSTLPVYMMTTEPSIQAAGNRLSASDYYLLLLDFLGRIGNGISLIFVAAAWPIASFVYIFLVYLFSEGELYDRKGYTVLLTSVLIYLFMKYFFLNDITRFVPGASFMEPQRATLLIYLIPISLTIFSSLVTWVTYLRRVGGDLSVIRAYLSIVLVDFALSISIYSIGRFE